MAKQSFVTGQVLTAQQVNDLQTNDFNQTVSAKTASYTLVAADKGTRITMSSTSATTITVNTGLFVAGDTLFIQNLNTGVCTITAGTATVDTSASLALAQHEGGTLYFTSAGVSTFFKAAGAAPSGTTFAGVSLKKSGSQSFSSGAGVNATFDEELFDTDGYHNTSTNTDRITIPSGKAGYYLIFGRATWSYSSTGQRIGTIRKNVASTQLAQETQINMTSSYFTSLTVQIVANLAVGDYVVFENYQDGTGSLDLLGGSQLWTTFTAIYLGA